MSRVSKEQQREEKQRQKHFEVNQKYFTICCYTVVTFVICLFIYKFTGNWSATKSRLASIAGVLAPFLLAFLIVYFVTPMTRNIDKLLFGRLKIEALTKFHKALSLVIAYAIIIGFLAMVLTFIVPQMITSITDLVVLIQNFYDNFEDMFNDYAAAHPNVNLEFVQQYISENLPDLLNYVKDYITNLIPMIYEAGRSVVSWVVNIVLAFVISCYLLWDKQGILDAMKRFVRVFFSEKQSKKIFSTTKECNRIFSKYIIGKAIDSLIIGLLCFAMMCILNLPYAVLISVVVGITNMIPYFGPFIGAVPGALLLLMISPKSCLIFIILILVLQQFDGAILGPKIIGNSTGLPPLGVIFGILIGSYAAGVVGMFIGVPVVAVCVYLINLFVDYRIYKKKIKENPEYSEQDDIVRMSDEEIGFSYDE